MRIFTGIQRKKRSRSVKNGIKERSSIKKVSIVLLFQVSVY